MFRLAVVLLGVILQRRHSFGAREIAGGRTSVRLFTQKGTGDLRLINPPLPGDLPAILGRSLLTPANPDPRPHSNFEAPDAKTLKNH
jgi:hypothetical protein